MGETTAQDLILEDLREIKDNLKKLDEAIRGNGHPGLNQRVALLEQRINYLFAGMLAGLPMAWDFVKRQFGW